MGGDTIWEIGSGYFGCRNADSTFCKEKFAETATRDQIKMVELKLSQGAKPGHGGVLPAAKVTPEIAVGGYFSYGFGQAGKLPIAGFGNLCDTSGVDCSAGHAESVTRNDR